MKAFFKGRVLLSVVMKIYLRWVQKPGLKRYKSINSEPPLMEQNLALGPNHKGFEKFVFGANFTFFGTKNFITFLDISDLQDHHIKF